VQFACLQNCAICCRASPITVLPHEVYILKSQGSKLGVDVKFKPAYTIVELRSGVRLALSYLMLLDENSKCPFLSGFKCTIHNSYKPLTCRAFPYLPRVIRYVLDKRRKELELEVSFTVSTLCPVVKKMVDNGGLPLTADPRVAYSFYPREVVAAIEIVRARKLYARILSELWREGLVELDEVGGYAPYPIVNSFLFIRSIMPSFTVGEIIKYTELARSNEREPTI